MLSVLLEPTPPGILIWLVNHMLGFGVLCDLAPYQIGADFWVEYIRVNCIILYRDRDRQR